MKEKNTGKKITGTNLGIIFSIMGIITSLILIVLNFVNGESMTIGIILLLSCSGSLSAIISNKKNNK
jgi:hypothetical protein